MSKGVDQGLLLLLKEKADAQAFTAAEKFSCSSQEGEFGKRRTMTMSEILRMAMRQRGSGGVK